MNEDIVWELTLMFLIDLKMVGNLILILSTLETADPKVIMMVYYVLILIYSLYMIEFMVFTGSVKLVKLGAVFILLFINKICVSLRILID